jgi:hypothetical protein
MARLSHVFEALDHDELDSTPSAQDEGPETKDKRLKQERPAPVTWDRPFKHQGIVTLF